MNKNLKLRTNQGQILVIILLIMVVGMTIGLFLLGKTTTDVSLTSKITDSSRAFNAAEAGIEEAIRAIDAVAPGSPVPFAPGVSYTVNKDDLGVSGNYPSSIGDPLSLGDAFSVWLATHNETTGELDLTSEGNTYQGNVLSICFGASSASYSPELPAIGVTVFYLESGRFQSASSGFDADATRSPSNGFENTVGVSANCAEYKYRADINFNSSFGTNLNSVSVWLLALQIRPLYVSVPVAVYTPEGFDLPKQGNYITSVGTGSETTRKIIVDNPYKVPAPFMDYVIYSTGNVPLTHN